MAVVITATQQDVYPPRVLVAVTGLTLLDDVELYRSVAGVRTALRGGSVVDTDDTVLNRTDSEQPYGVPVTYVAVVNGTTEYATSAHTYVLTGGKVALSDGITGASAEVVISAWPDKSWSPQASTFSAGGRNYTVKGPLGQYVGQVELFTETTSAATNLMNLMRSATQGIVQARQPGGYDGVDAYWSVTGIREVRHSQDGTDQRRRWTLTVVEVDAWPAALIAAHYTLGDLADAFAGGTLQDIADAFAGGTLLDIALADLADF